MQKSKPNKTCKSIASNIFLEKQVILTAYLIIVFLIICFPKLLKLIKWLLCVKNYELL